MSFTTTSSVKVRMQANGSVAGVGGTTSWIRCVFRFLVDGSPLAGTDPNFGDAIISPGKLEMGTGEWTQYFVNRRTQLAAGAHTIKLQLAHGYTMYTTTDGTCSSDEQTYSRARLEVWVDP